MSAAAGLNNNRQPYTGSSRKLIYSIDIGTTFSAVSYCLLVPGGVPKFVEILAWPMQATSDAKVPSVLYYDRDGKACAFGAETEDEDTIIQAESEEWHKAEWWKLYLRPSHLPIIRNLELPPLPPNTTVDNIFVDYLRYVKKQVRDHITASYGGGDNIWASLTPSMCVILTTPNGWEGSQQQRMRQAAINGGLVTEDGGRRVKFVTEAEAAVLYAADSGFVGDWLVKGGHLILCDCGGGTIDITGYKIRETKPLQLEESAASRCYLAGAVFVTQAAKVYLKTRLAGTEWDNDESMQRAIYHFDKNAKRKFDDLETPQWIHLDGYKNVPALGITHGRIKISGKDMASFFESSLNSIKEGLEIAFENGDRMADKVILVGGLASSPYIYSKLVKWGKEFGISVSRPDGPTVKAVANGALAWHIDNSVSSRYSKFHYGAKVALPYDSTNPEMQGRVPSLGADGVKRVGFGWEGIVAKNVKIAAKTEFCHSLCWKAEGMNRNDTTTFDLTVDIYVYRRATPPTFITFPGKRALQPGFEMICQVRGNLQKVYDASLVQTNSGAGARWRTLEFDVCLSLGETEVTARLRWKEKGETKYGPAVVVYE